MSRYILTFILLAIISAAAAQRKDPKALLRDSLDGKFDFSDFLIETPGGFIPVPSIITEPALGNIGITIAPVFIKRGVEVIDTIRGVRQVVRTQPNISGGALMYTANNSYAAFLFRSSTWIAPMIKYRVGGGFANINLNFYRTGTSGSEERFGINFKTFPISLTMLKVLHGTPWSAGIRYNYQKTEVSPQEGSLPAFIQSKEVKSTVSMPGIVIEYEGRDNIFTPDKGLRIHASMSWSDEAFGSDWNYSNLNAYAFYYLPVRENLIAGLRYEMRQVFGNAPFYLLPYIDLRGIPIARYQGNIFSVGELEMRWDVVRRWSAVFFAGSGKAYDTWGEFSSASWHSSGGAGFRYLVARKFKLRMGIDVARGPEQWAYYIVFGSSWGR